MYYVIVSSKKIIANCRWQNDRFRATVINTLVRSFFFISFEMTCNLNLNGLQKTAFFIHFETIGVRSYVTPSLRILRCHTVYGIHAAKKMPFIPVDITSKI